MTGCGGLLVHYAGSAMSIFMEIYGEVPGVSLDAPGTGGVVGLSENFGMESRGKKLCVPYPRIVRLVSLESRIWTYQT